jgi:hypothetical protein
VGGAVRGVHDVEGPVSLLESFRDERHEHTIHLFPGMEKGAGVTGMGEGGTGKVHRFVFSRHLVHH